MQIEMECFKDVDYSTYTEQSKIFLQGERDYSKLDGRAGSVQYPTLHVYFYSFMYLVTGIEDNLVPAKLIFLVLYLILLITV